MLDKIKRSLVKVFPFPVTAVFEPTTMCNLRCKACARWYWENPSYGRHLTLENYKKALGNILDSVIWIPSIAFVSPGGEPLTNPEFNSIIGYNFSKNISSIVTTNGTLLTQDIVNFWKSHKVSRVAISVDSCEVDEYESIRIGAKFERVKNSCKMVSEAGIHLQLNTIIFESNVDKLMGMAKLAKEVRASKVYYIKPQYTGEFVESLDPKVTKERLQLFTEVRTYLKDNNIGWLEPVSMETYFRPCLFPFTTPWIMIDGSIRPCCFIFGNHDQTLDGYTYKIDGDKYLLGNIYKDNFLKVWLGRGFTSLRDFIKATEYKEGEKIDMEQLKEWKRYPLSPNRFEHCRACLWRWSAAC